MINTKRLTDSFCSLVAIDSLSFKEEKMVKYLNERLLGLGIKPHTDKTGNIYAFVKGSLSGDAVLFCAHTDTVAPGIGKRAVVHPDGKITSNGDTVLGADDMSGVAAILEMLEVLKENNIPHRDTELLFPSAEEVYIKGSSAFDFSAVKAKTAYVLDLDGNIGNAAYAAPSLISFEINVKGRAAHAGFAPEDGINAAAAAAEAVTMLKQGRVDDISTLNIGIISGGTATNIVPAYCSVKGELRSLDHKNALGILNQVKAAFETAAQKYGAEVEIKHCTDLTAYRTDPNGRAAEQYKAACRKCGIEPELVTTFGGSDNNSLALHGIEGLVLSAGYHNAHTCGEYIYIKDMEALTRIILNLVI